MEPTFVYVYTFVRIINIHVIVGTLYKHVHFLFYLISNLNLNSYPKLFIVKNHFIAALMLLCNSPMCSARMADRMMLALMICGCIPSVLAPILVPK